MEKGTDGVVTLTFPMQFRCQLDLFSNNSIELFGPLTVTLDVFLKYGKVNEEHKKTSVRLEKEGRDILVAEFIL